MRIPIRPSPDLETTRPTHDLPLAFIDGRPFLIELQGSLSASDGSEDMAGVSVGKLDTSDPKRPVLQIAHHRLEGKPVRLETPFAILKTVMPAREADGQEASGGAVSGGIKKVKREKEESATEAEAITIEALVWDKLLFSKRPEPIIQLSSDI